MINTIKPDKFYSFPEDEGKTVIDAILTTKKNLCLVTYDFGDTEISNALIKIQKENNVRLNIMLDKSRVSKVNKIKEILIPLAINKNNKFRWSSSYFQITHEKYILIDALNDKDEFEFNENTKLLIGSHNYEGFNGKNFAAAREFGCVLERAEFAPIIKRITEDFLNDFNNNVPLDLSQEKGPIYWSNGWAKDGEFKKGSLIAKMSDFPFEDETVKINGTAFKTIVNLIKNAKESISFYEQEFNCLDFAEYLSDALNRNVKVTGIVESYGIQPHQDYIIDLVSKGAIFYESSKSKSLYIHAKAICIDNKILSIGSTNFSTNSLLNNKEANILLESKEVIDHFNSVFKKDIENNQLTPETTLSIKRSVNNLVGDIDLSE